MPSIFGKPMSSTTASYGSLSPRKCPSSPSKARSTTYPASVSAVVSWRLRSGSSSTTSKRTRLSKYGHYSRQDERGRREWFMTGGTPQDYFFFTTALNDIPTANEPHGPPIR